MIGLPPWLQWIRDAEHGRRLAVLAQTPVFAGLPRRLLGRLAVQLFEKSYAPGELIFRQGDPGKGLFVVLDGAVEVLREGPEGEQPLAAFGPGTAFGELALIDDLPRSATARAIATTRLLILYRSHFEALVEGDRSIALVVMHNLLRTLSGYVRAASAAAPARGQAPVAKPAGDGAGAARTPSE